MKSDNELVLKEKRKKIIPLPLLQCTMLLLFQWNYQCYLYYYCSYCCDMRFLQWFCVCMERAHGSPSCLPSVKLLMLQIHVYVNLAANTKPITQFLACYYLSKCNQLVCLCVSERKKKCLNRLIHFCVKKKSMLIYFITAMNNSWGLENNHCSLSIKVLLLFTAT